VTSGVARGGASGGSRPGVQVLGAHQHTFCSHLKTRFKQKIRQNMLKNAYFFEKIVKNRLSVGGSAPRTPVCLRRQGAPPLDPRVGLLPTITALSSSFLAPKYILLPSKRKKIITVTACLLIKPKVRGFCGGPDFIQPNGAI